MRLPRRCAPRNDMMYLNYNHIMRKFIMLCILLTTACGTNVPNATPAPKNLKLYFTLTSTATASHLDGLVLSATTPLPSPTPFMYAVKSGDTLGAIAQKFNVTLSELMAANPNVNANAMSIGQKLNIPSQQSSTSGSTPTPVPFPVKQIQCYPTSDRGMWCFVLIDNNSANPIEDVTAQITMMDESGKSIASQTAILPLDFLSPNSSMPLTTYFAPDIPLTAKPRVQILTAIQIRPNDPRYLSATLQNTPFKVDSSGLTAQVSGQVVLPASSQTAKLIWVVATAYDALGNVIGVRRWESTSALSAGSNLPFSFVVSSIAGTISRVELSVEAKP
jgi:LysM repeat protein